jgi:hypothetical protein
MSRELSGSLRAEEWPEVICLEVHYVSVTMRRGASPGMVGGVIRIKIEKDGKNERITDCMREMCEL